MLTVNQRARVRAAIAPMHVEARVSSAQTSQVVHGRTVQLLEQHGDWWRIQSEDDYQGFMHYGYLENVSGTEDSWLTCLNAVVVDSESGRERALPFRSRVPTETSNVSGKCVLAAELVGKYPATPSDVINTAREFFTGAPYQWGGVTQFGCDCSGIVQSVYALHGIALPRDAYQQALIGSVVSIDALNNDSLQQLNEGDLLYFSDRPDKKITHIGIAVANGRMFHSALGRGGAHLEDLRSDEDYVKRLRANFVSARRVL